jgi:hypothetical protein
MDLSSEIVEIIKPIRIAKPVVPELDEPVVNTGKTHPIGAQFRYPKSF